MKCKFCGCTDDRPCRIPAIVSSEGEARFTAAAIAIVGPGEQLEMLPCSWLIEQCCTAPACVAKAYDAIGWIHEALIERRFAS